MAHTLHRRHAGARSISVAVAGLFAGHVLVYRLVAPNALQRAVLLAGTGHAYLPLALALGTGLAAMAGILAFALGLRRGASRAEQPGPSLVWAVAVPALAQAVAFLALESLERALAGAPLSTMVGPLLPVGVALQLIVGALGGLVLFGLDRAGERIGRAVNAPAVRSRQRPSTLLAPGAFGFVRLRPAEAFSSRGPPHAA